MKNLTQIEDLSGATNANYNSDIAGLAKSVPTKEDIAKEAAKQLLTNENM